MFKNIIFVIFVALIIIGGIWYSGQSQNPADTALETNNSTSTMNTSIQGLTITDVVVGLGAEAKKGNQVTVHYTGTFDDGKKFDSSYDHGAPFTFTLGAGKVIQGWDLGVVGMKVGGKRELIISSDLAYGDMGYPPVIPGKATLHFTVELLAVK